MILIFHGLLHHCPIGVSWSQNGAAQLQIVDADGARLGEVSGVPNSVAIQQGGLLDVAVSSTGIVYLTYAKLVGNRAALAVAHGVLDQNTLIQVEEFLFKRLR